MPQTATRISAVANVMVPVRDQDAAIAFYVDKLGFEKRVDIPYGDDGERWVEVAPAGAQTSIAFTQERDEWQVGRSTGITLLTADIDALHARLSEAGVDVDEVTRLEPPVPPMAWLRDADGNTLLVVEG